MTLGFGGGAGPGVPGRPLHRLAARPLVRRVDQQPYRRQPDGHRHCSGRRAERHRLVRRHVCPRHPVAGQPGCADRRRLIGLPAGQPIKAWEIVRDRGAHVSIANLIEMQMRHGMPPFQLALDHGILPSLSPDVDTNMTTDPFSLMRGAFCLQRALANDLAFRESNPGSLPIPQLVTSRQVIEMATIAGAAANRILDKVGTLTPGKEADIVVLDARNINTWPMNNVPGTIVTMMNPRHVRDVLIAGKVVYWKGTLVGWDVERCSARQSRRATACSHGSTARRKSVRFLPGNNSFSNPYRPNFLGNCCHKGANTTAPEYVLRP